jgi:hypothetical protein
LPHLAQRQQAPDTRLCINLTEIHLIALTIIFTALLLMAVESAMLTRPLAAPLTAKLGERVQAEA